MDDRRFIWIDRWKEFQHYRPDRQRGPAWIKDYTAQIDDERYLQLSDRQRALLRDLRDVFAMMRGRLSDDTRTITRKRGAQTRRSDLDALNHAGFIHFVSREDLEKRLEEFYSSPRAPARSREGEEDKRTPLPPFRTTPNPSPNGQVFSCDHCVGGLTFRSQQRLDEHLRNVHDIEEVET